MGRCAYYQAIAPRLLDRLLSQPRLVLGVLALQRPSPEARRAEFSAKLASLTEARREQALQGFDRLLSLRDLDCLAPDRDREAWGLEVLRHEGFSAADLAAE